MGDLAHLQTYIPVTVAVVVAQVTQMLDMMNTLCDILLLVAVLQ